MGGGELAFAAVDEDEVGGFAEGFVLFEFDFVVVVAGSGGFLFELEEARGFVERLVFGCGEGVDAFGFGFFD